MKLTPMDINNKEFKRGIRGYSPEEVDEFLDEVVESYEELYKDNTRLKEKLSAVTDKVEHYSKIETTIQNTLVLAQNAAEQAKISSQKEAEMIIKNANETAQKILDKAHSDVVEINAEYEKAKQEFVKFRAKFRSFITTQLDTFEDLEKDLNKSYGISSPVEESIDEKEITFAEEELAEVEENIDEIKSFFASSDDDE
ncbi:MAG: DivIVA domain-containing protein [Clostridium sp.]|nr:DivIVA domain-containing protein [Clostridium sp.]